MGFIVQICEIVSGIAAAIAIMISIVLYIHSLNRERKLDTLKNLSEIRRKYFNTKNLNADQKLQYLNELEYFATGLNAKIFEIKIVKKMSGSRLLKQYENWIKNFIQQRKAQQGNDKAYCEYEKMIKKLKKGSRSLHATKSQK